MHSYPGCYVCVVCVFLFKLKKRGLPVECLAYCSFYLSLSLNTLFLCYYFVQRFCNSVLFSLPHTTLSLFLSTDHGNATKNSIFQFGYTQDSASDSSHCTPVIRPRALDEPQARLKNETAINPRIPTWTNKYAAIPVQKRSSIRSVRKSQSKEIENRTTCAQNA
jgi:hypothetical protein